MPPFGQVGQTPNQVTVHNYVQTMQEHISGVKEVAPQEHERVEKLLNINMGIRSNISHSKKQTAHNFPAFNNDVPMLRGLRKGHKPFYGASNLSSL